MIARIAAATVASLLLLGGSAAGGFAVGSRTEAPEATTSIPLTVDREGDDVDVLVPVVINGQGPFRFVLDTGASTSAVSRKVLKAIGAGATGERVETSDASGDVSKSRTYWLDSWKAGKISLQRDAVVTDLGPDFEGDGLLGSDQLRHFGRVTIDYEHRRLLLTPKH